MKTLKKIIIAITILAVVVLIIFVFVVPMAINSQNKMTYGTFQDLEETKDCFRTNYEIKIQDLSDNALGNLVPTDSFCCEYQYEGKSYQVYAYVFKSADDAKAYFKNHTGNLTQDLTENFSLSSNTYFSTAFTSYKDCNAWHIAGGSLAQFNNMYAVLSEFLL